MAGHKHTPGGFTRIYLLRDPQTNAPMYVGKSGQRHISTRLAQHMMCADKSPRSEWIKRLLSAGLKPALEVLEEVPHSDALRAEQHWIGVFASYGAPLNRYDPDLRSPRPKSSREKISAFRKQYVGWKHSPSTRAKIGRAGESNSQAKLDEAMVREIRAMCAGGATQVSVSLHFGVSKQTICDVVRRKKWAHVE